MPSPGTPVPRSSEQSAAEAAERQPPRDGGEPTQAAALALARLAPGLLTSAFAVPLLPVVVLGSVLFALLVPQRFAWTDGPIVFTAGPATAPLTGPESAALAVFALALPLALGISLTAALVVATASCLDVPVSARTAVRWAARPRRATGAAVLAAALFLSAPVPALVVAERFTVLWGLAAGAVPLWAATVLAHRAARLVAVPPRAAGPRIGRAWWPVPRGRIPSYTLRPAVTVVTTLAVALLVGWGTSFLPGPPPFRWTTALFLVGAVCVAGGSWLAALLVTGAMEYRDSDAPGAVGNEHGEERAARRDASVEELRAALLGPLAPAPAGGKASESRLRNAFPVLGAAVAAVLVLPGALWVRPGEPVDFSVEYVSMDRGQWPGWDVLNMAAFDDGLRLSAPTVELWCAPRCTVALHPRDEEAEAGEGTHSRVPGGQVRAVWERGRPPADSDADRAWTLTLGTDCDARGCHGPEQELDTLEVFGDTVYEPVYLADVAEYDDGFHVVSAFPEGGGTMVLDVRSCDEECSAPVTVGRFPASIERGSPEHLLDTATGPAGEPAATLYDRHTGAVHLFRCSDTACTATSSTEIVPPAVAAHNILQPAAWDGTRTGARTEVRPDGRPVVAYRATDGSARLVDCASADCADFTERVLTGPGWEQHLPGLALDPQGRPVLALADSGTAMLSLVACTDTGCSEWDSLVLHDAVRVRSGAELLIDDGGRPVVAAFIDPAAVRADGYGLNGVVALHRCAEPGCGLGD